MTRGEMPTTRPASPTTEPADAAGAIAALRAAVARGDAAAIEALLATANDDETLLRRDLAGAMASVGDFARALADRFGAAAAGRWGTKAGDAAPAAAGDTVRVDGRWRVTFAGAAALLRARGVDGLVPTEDAFRRVAAMRTDLRNVTAELRLGTYATPDAAVDAARAAWQGASSGLTLQ